jgi:hypothetical protein
MFNISIILAGAFIGILLKLWADVNPETSTGFFSALAKRPRNYWYSIAYLFVLAVGTMYFGYRHTCLFNRWDFLLFCSCSIVLIWEDCMLLIAARADKDDANLNSNAASSASTSFLPFLILLVGTLQLSGWWSVFGVGILGGMVVELLELKRLLKKGKKIISRKRTVVYWVINVVIILIGGIVATLYGYTNVDPLISLHIGASAPAIIHRLVR